MADILSRLANLEVPQEDLAFRDTEALRDWLYSLEHVDVTRIGESRDRQELFGLRFGEGRRRVSIVAGSHADEPVGPMTAQALPRILRAHFPELLETFRFQVVPQMNPDGADVNRPWFREPFDLAEYLDRAVRELPGADIEFGWSKAPGARPENLAAMRYLKSNAPYEAHFSLHGMGFAEGAWCLISPEWIDRADGYMNAFASLCARRDFSLHDIDRKGEKGFHRIREGFTTHPNSVAMKEFFLERNDSATAQKFRPSSMEWVRQQGGDPFCVISELPIFRIGKRSESLDRPVGAELREAFQQAHAKGGLDPGALRAIEERFQLSPVSPAEQVPLQVAMIVLALTEALPSVAPVAEEDDRSA